jgi:hypothetical protein
MALGTWLARDVALSATACEGVASGTRHGLWVVYPQTFYTDLNVLFCKEIA